MVRLFGILSLVLYGISGSVYYYRSSKLAGYYSSQILKCHQEDNQMKAYELEVEWRGQDKAYSNVTTWVFISACICSSIAFALREDY